MPGDGFRTRAIDPSELADAEKLLKTLRARQPKEEALEGAATSRKYDNMGAEDWAKLSKEEQWKAVLEINQQLDAEMGESEPLDSKALEAALGLGGAGVAVK